MSKEMVYLSDFPRAESETTDNRRVERWLAVNHRSIHMWSGVLEIEPPGIIVRRPLDIRGVRGHQGNRLLGTQLKPVGKWCEDQSVLTLHGGATSLDGLIIHTAVEGGLPENDPGYGLVIRKCHGSIIENIVVQGIRDGNDPGSLAAKRRWRGARRAGIYTDWMNGGKVKAIVRQLGTTGVILSQTNGLRADLKVHICNGNGVEVWNGRIHPWTIFTNEGSKQSESGAGFRLLLWGEGLDGWALKASGSSCGTVLGGYIEAVEGGIWLDNSRCWSINMPRAGSLPLRLTGGSWDTRIEWLVGMGSRLIDGRSYYSPIELGYYMKKVGQDRVRTPIPESWLLNFDTNCQYASHVGYGFRPAILRIEEPPPTSEG